MLILLVASLLLPLFGCSSAQATTGTSVPADSTPSTKTSATDDSIEPTSGATLDPARGPSGTLRLWWSPHQDLNPLLDQAPSGQAGQGLIFQSLFERDTEWNLQPVLVKNFSYSADRLQLTLILNSGITFHNGQVLTASDVLACLNFIQLSGALSPYAADLTAYSSGRLMNDTTLVLQLGGPDPDFLYALTFPVVPASQLNLPSGSLIAGTGRYQMTALSPEGVLTLTWADPGTAATTSLQKIQLKPYASAIEAMKAVEDDELDLVFLAENDLTYYDVRSSLRLDRYIGRHYVYLAINSSSVAAAAPEQRYLSLKYLLRSARWFNLPDPWSGQAADLPIPAFHACFDRHPLDFEALWTDILSGQASTTSETSTGTPTNSTSKALGTALTLPASNRTLRIIAPANLPHLVKIAGQTKQWIVDSGQPAETEILAADLYQATLAGQSYDLAVCESVIPPSAEPGWLLQGSTGNSAQLTQGLPATVGNGYDGDQSDLAKGWPFFGLLGQVRFDDPEVAAAQAADYRTILAQAAMRSPYIGIMLRESAVAYGDRVQGQCIPSLNQPYRGIEDLWIWSGLSS
jgi:hypothetical protein